MNGPVQISWLGPRERCINNHKMFIQNFLFIFHFQLKLVNIEILFSLCGTLVHITSVTRFISILF